MFVRSPVDVKSNEEMLAKVEEKFARVQEAVAKAVTESKALFVKTKEEIEQILDAKYEVEKSRVVRQFYFYITPIFT